MLRDLLSRSDASDALQENRKPDADTTSPEPQKDDDDFLPVSHSDREPSSDDELADSFFHPLHRLQGRLKSRRNIFSNREDDLHPYTQILSVSNVDDCFALDLDTFPDHERCSKEKFHYRLTKCPELSLGLFSIPPLTSSGDARRSGPAELLAHIVATRTPALSVTDASMDYPRDWRTAKSALSTKESLGHHDQGGTIALHSLSVSSSRQRKGLGTILLKAYIQRIRDSRIADRIALLAHGHLIKFYESFGFINMGESSCTYGAGGWNNLVLPLEDFED